MRFPRSLLLISVLTAGLYSQAPLSAPAQQPNTVTVRSRINAPQPGIPEVKATADRTRVPVGDQVTFTLSPASVVKDPRYQVTLFFGDSPRGVVMHQAQIVHIYQTSGNYTYSILVELVKRPTPTSVIIPDVRLKVTSRTGNVNQPVNFAGELSRPTLNVSYRFDFGDGLNTDWQTESKANHVYAAPGVYRPYVDIGLRERGIIKQVGGSNRETITITPGANVNGNNNTNDNVNTGGTRNGNRSNNNGNGNFSTRPNGNLNGAANGNSNGSGNLNASTNRNSNRREANVNANATPQASATSSASPAGITSDSQDVWWPYLVFLPLLLLAGYKAVTYFLLPRPTFVPHLDVGKAEASGLALDYQVDLDPNVDGAFKIDTEGGSLIKGTRKSDD